MATETDKKVSFDELEEKSNGVDEHDLEVGEEGEEVERKPTVVIMEENQQQWLRLVFSI